MIATVYARNAFVLGFDRKAGGPDQSSTSPLKEIQFGVCSAFFRDKVESPELISLRNFWVQRAIGVLLCPGRVSFTY